MRPDLTARAADAWATAAGGLRRALLTAFAFSAVINVLMLTGSLYMLQVYDRVLSSGSVPTLLGLFAIVVVLHGFLALYDILRARVMGRAGARLDRDLGAAAFARWIRPASRPTGAEPQPLRDLDTLRGFLAGGGATALLDAPWVPVFLLALFLVHPVLGWLTIGGMALAAGLALANHLLTRGAIARQLLRDGEERDLADRARRAAEAVAGLGMGPALTARWQERRDAALMASQASGDPAEVLAGISRSTRMLLQSGILTAGAWLVISGEISGGMIVASSILSGRALAPVDQIVGQWRGIRRAALARRALAELLGQPDGEAARRLRLPDPEGRLQVAGLTRLGAAEGRPPLLDAVAFSLEPGAGLAVMGASGSGKSTLARMLVGALPADRGEVRLDGATLDQWDPAEIGRHLGYLPQAPDGLSGSVRDLIARFDRGATDEEVIAAARLAGIHDLVLSLPQGYGTLVGGRTGVALSGGQAQRLGLARAVFRRPRLVVLDEPDAHLDATGEAALVEAIRTLREDGSTVVVVAHRPTTLAALDTVLVLEKGRVARFGALEADGAADGAAGGDAIAARDPVAPGPDAREARKATIEALRAAVRAPAPVAVPAPVAAQAPVAVPAPAEEVANLFGADGATEVPDEPERVPLIVPARLHPAIAAAAAAAAANDDGLDEAPSRDAPEPPPAVVIRMQRLSERRRARLAGRGGR